jgi:DNA polymerase III alpha subunit
MKTDLENIQLLLDRFKRPIPDKQEYKNRLAEEFELILNQRFTDYFLQICDIIDITQDLTHMTRGSAGSSLVCYLLGITDVDPIKWNIPVARFMNPLRDDLPDVDIDFQHWQQGEVMQRIFKKWPGKTARLSNYVMFREKSAKKEAAKRLGAKGNLPRNFTYESVGVDPKEAKRIERKLIGKKRAISKHCGGIVMFTRQLPKSLISQDNQILLDKYEVEDLEHLKVDILANRGLSQLLEIDEITKLEYYPETDEATSELLCRGDVLGVTQGESPAMRRLFRALQPKSMQDCDDAIDIISNIIGVDMYEADMYRRAFAKKNDEKILEFVEKMGGHPRKQEAMAALQELSGFGLCRAHAVNLGRLIWALAYQKAHNTKEFWRANLKHCQGSYRSWVYQCEAHRLNLPTKSGWWWHGFPKRLGVRQQWMDRVEFAGVIANGRCYRGKKGRWVTFLTLGTNYGEYIDVVVQKPFAYRDGDIIHGSGRIKHSNNSDYIDSSDVKSYTFAEWR